MNRATSLALVGLAALGLTLPACKSASKQAVPAEQAPVHSASAKPASHHPAKAVHPPIKNAAPVPVATGPLGVAGISAQLAPSWVKQAPSNRMRKAQYEIPGKDGAGSLVVFRFPGGAGAAKQNLDRWIGQFEPAAAKSAKTKTTKQGALTIHALEVQGEYQARPMPGQDPKTIPSGQQRLLAAVVEGHGDPLYLKLLGPVATVKAQAKAWNQLLGSLAIKR